MLSASFAKPAIATTTDAFSQGESAFRSNKTLFDNPYTSKQASKRTKKLSNSWIWGWYHGQNVAIPADQVLRSMYPSRA